MTAKRSITYDGQTYKVRSGSVQIPDFEKLDRLEILLWINRHTYARGRSTVKSNPLAGYGGTVVSS